MDINLTGLKETLINNSNKTNIVANNLANINTNGYKRDVSFLELINNGEKTKLSSETDYSQGQIKQTGNPLDIAISGEGFFVINNGQEDMYSRDGHFNIDSEGALVTSNGGYVMGLGGQIYLSQNGKVFEDLSITKKGEIFSGENLIAELKSVLIDDKQSLLKEGTNLYKIKDASSLRINENVTILQGCLEASNVNPIHEMIDLIEVQRRFERAQKTIHSIDQAIGKAVNQVAR